MGSAFSISSPTPAPPPCTPRRGAPPRPRRATCREPAPTGRPAARSARRAGGAAATPWAPERRAARRGYSRRARGLTGAAGSTSAGRDHRLPGLFAHRVRFRVGVIDAIARGVPPEDAVQILELKIPVAGVLTRHLPLVIRGRLVLVVGRLLQRALELRRFQLRLL